MTDFPPLEASSIWYGMRSWMECCFKDTKRGGLDWHLTKMTNPKRAERHWLAFALGVGAANAKGNLMVSKCCW
ncbi:hypothetical protein [Nostoc sp.]|uniref:hypothetical protein n=1 Tax=Nostoc sp. TaxID=1180 RepID=UPI002FFD34EA